MAEAWSVDEVDRTIDVYFSMLDLELDGVEYSKAAHRRDLMKSVPRSNGSIEYKFQNISAVLMELGAVSIIGYKPATNVQALLRTRVGERFEDASALRRKMMHAVEAPAGDISSLALGSPVAAPDGGRIPRRRARQGRHVDYQAMEAANRQLGLAGELLVVRAEQRRLQALGRHDLASRVRHVSVEEGDGLGFDVASWTEDGQERFLEVKTTRANEFQPFLVSRNEVEFSQEEDERFVLTRLFSFGRPAMGFYELQGALETSAMLLPQVYSGLPK